jgi:hypothetical protein
MKNELAELRQEHPKDSYRNNKDRHTAMSWAFECKVVFGD